MVTSGSLVRLNVVPEDRETDSCVTILLRPQHRILLFHLRVFVQIELSHISDETVRLLWIRWKEFINLHERQTRQVYQRCPNHEQARAQPRNAGLSTVIAERIGCGHGNHEVHIIQDAKDENGMPRQRRRGVTTEVENPGRLHDMLQQQGLSKTAAIER